MKLTDQEVMYLLRLRDGYLSPIDRAALLARLLSPVLPPRLSRLFSKAVLRGHGFLRRPYVGVQLWFAVSRRTTGEARRVACSECFMSLADYHGLRGRTAAAARCMAAAKRLSP